jgi:hypothetical protein
MPDNETWLSRIIQVVRSAFKAKDEVKTPLSFFFRVTLVLPVLALPLLVSAGTPEVRVLIFELALGLLFFLCLVVAAFAWFKPKSLVYGESGHRAEFKVEFGTEKRTMTHREVVTLEGEQNPKALAEPEQKANTLPEPRDIQPPGENL